MKKVWIVCVIVFVLILGILIIKSNKKRDSVLPFPSEEFQRWEKQWEKQRL